MVTWLHLRTYHLLRTIKEVGLLNEDHLPQSMTRPVQLLNQTIHLRPNTSHFAHYTISGIEGVAAMPCSVCVTSPVFIKFRSMLCYAIDHTHHSVLCALS